MFSPNGFGKRAQRLHESIVGSAQESASQIMVNHWNHQRSYSI